MGSADLFGHCRDAHDRVLFGHRGGGTDLELAPIGTGSRRQHWRAGSRHGRSGDAASTAALPIGASSKAPVEYDHCHDQAGDIAMHPEWQAIMTADKICGESAYQSEPAGPSAAVARGRPIRRAAGILRI